MPRKKPYYRPTKMFKSPEPTEPPRNTLSLEQNISLAVMIQNMLKRPSADQMKEILRKCGGRKITTQAIAEGMQAFSDYHRALCQIARTAPQPPPEH